MPVRRPGIQRHTRRWIAALVFTTLAFDPVSATLMAAERSFLDPAEPTSGQVRSIVLLVDNLAGLPDSELETAQALATAVLRSARLEATWADCRAGAPGEAGLTVWIVLGTADRSDRMIARLRGSADLLGMAPQGNGRVYIFPERIRRYAASKRRSFEEVLGHVLAHEVGHHLLPGQGHANTGIMQADIGDAASTPWFTAHQIRTIHASLPGTAEGLVLESTHTRLSAGP